MVAVVSTSELISIASCCGLCVSAGLFILRSRRDPARPQDRTSTKTYPDEDEGLGDIALTRYREQHLDSRASG